MQRAGLAFIWQFPAGDYKAVLERTTVTALRDVLGDSLALGAKSARRSLNMSALNDGFIKRIKSRVPTLLCEKVRVIYVEQLKSFRPLLFLPL